MGKFTVRLVLFICIFVSSRYAMALDSFFVGPRALGMAGANVASPKDTTAQYYNPAAFGFINYQEKGSLIGFDTKKFRWDINAGAGYRLHNDLGDLIEDASDINTTTLSTGSVVTSDDVKNFVKLAEIISRVDDPGNAITVDLNAGTAFRIKQFIIGARGLYQASGRVSAIDTSNLGLSGSVNLNTEINNISLPGDDGQALLFTQSQQSQLSSAGLNSSAIQNLDFAARVAGVDSGTLQSTIDLLASMANATINNVGGSLESNTTRVTLEGFAFNEFPISYGYAFNENIAVGGNLKFILGRVYGATVSIFGNDASDVLKDVDDNYEDTAAFGIDLGVLARIPKFNFGLVARNVNSPKFNGLTVNNIQFNDITVNPQLTVGAAFMPFKSLTIETDYDLTRNETVFEDYETQNVSLGAEWILLRILALRAGVYSNLAESDIDWVYTAGLGADLKFLRLDLGGAIAEKSIDFSGEDVPVEARVALSLSLTF